MVGSWKFQVCATCCGPNCVCEYDCDCWPESCGTTDLFGNLAHLAPNQFLCELSGMGSDVLNDAFVLEGNQDDCPPNWNYSFDWPYPCPGVGYWGIQNIRAEAEYLPLTEQGRITVLLRGPPSDTVFMKFETLAAPLITLPDPPGPDRKIIDCCRIADLDIPHVLTHAGYGCTPDDPTCLMSCVE